ncbi:MAG: DNA-3-methyladenine glycosylase 2 family protein [Sphingomonadaceae bacterium]|nr:DNA-3-methyladenine glycosylase 2 family protein [Sphingomonadaceae bacterium]
MKGKIGMAQAELNAAIDALIRAEPIFGQAVDRVGYPEPRSRTPGYETLLRTIIGQQVSVKAAASIWAKLAAGLGDMTRPDILLSADPETLRGFGLSRQKQGYAVSLAQLVASGELDLLDLPKEDEEAIALLIRVKGIGRWSAEIYLMFAEGRADIWPAGDLAVQIEIGRLFGMDGRPSERTIRDMAEPWRPHRSAAAILAWHHYNIQAI